MGLYKLLVYLRLDEDHLALIEELIGEDKDQMLQEGKGRIQNNPNYRCIVVEYSATDATIIT
jgi:hypothetical protein